MGIDGGKVQQGVDAVDQALGDDVLQLLRLLVDFAPVQPHHLHQELLDQPVPAQHVQGQLLAARAQPHPAPRLVVHQARVEQRFDHAGGRSPGTTPMTSATRPMGTRANHARRLVLQGVVPPSHNFPPCCSPSLPPTGFSRDGEGGILGLTFLPALLVSSPLPGEPTPMPHIVTEPFG